MKHEPIKFTALGLLALALCAGILTLHTTTSGDEQAQQQFHCDMVSMWNEDAAQGIDERSRRGWPNYNNQECK